MRSSVYKGVGCESIFVAIFKFKIYPPYCGQATPLNTPPHRSVRDRDR